MVITVVLIVLAVIALTAALLAGASIRVLREYEPRSSSASAG